MEVQTLIGYTYVVTAKTDATVTDTKGLDLAVNAGEQGTFIATTTKVTVEGKATITQTRNFNGALTSKTVAVGEGGVAYTAGSGIKISGNKISADTATIATKSELTSNYVSKTDAEGTYAAKTDLANKQDKLTAGSNVTIEGNVISAVGVGESYNYISEDTQARTITLGTDSCTGGVKLGSKLIKKYEKWVIVGVYGQSNAVGYDESMLTKYDVPCEEGRVMQYSDSLKPLTFCAENLQDMNTIGKRSGSTANMAAARTNSITGDAFTPSFVDRTTKVATKGIHLPLANLICSVIPDDYGVIIVPGAYGGQTHTAFLKNTNYYNQFKTRLLNALALHEDNYLAGIVWCQGEFDTSAGTAKATYKTNFTQMITDLDNDIKTDNYKKLPDRTDPKKYWYVYEWPKYYKDADAKDLLGAQKEVVGESNYIAIPDETPYNETDYTSGTLAAHFAGDSFRKVIAPRVFAKMQSAGAFHLATQSVAVAENVSDNRVDDLVTQVGSLSDLVAVLQARVDELSAFHQLAPIEDTKVLTAAMITKGHNNGVLSDFTVVDGTLTIGTGSNIGGGTGALLLDDRITKFEGTFQTVGSNLANSFIAITAKSTEKEEGFFLNPVQNNKTYTSNAAFTQAAINGNYTPIAVSAGKKLTMEKTDNVVKVMIDDTVVFEGDMNDKVWAAATCTEACLGFGGAWTNRSNPGWVLTDCKVKMS